MVQDPLGKNFARISSLDIEYYTLCFQRLFYFDSPKFADENGFGENGSSYIFPEFLPLIESQLIRCDVLFKFTGKHETSPSPRLHAASRVQVLQTTVLQRQTSISQPRRTPRDANTAVLVRLQEVSGGIYYTFEVENENEKSHSASTQPGEDVEIQTEKTQGL